MNRETIEKAVLLGNRMGRVFIVTADREGLPHMAAAGKIAAESGYKINVSDWFCPGTLANLQTNPGTSIVVWDPEYDIGWQIIGNCERIEDLSMMDGFSPALEERAPLPQVERKIHVQVKKVIHFSHAPHSDMEE